MAHERCTIDDMPEPQMSQMVHIPQIKNKMFLISALSAKSAVRTFFHLLFFSSSLHNFCFLRIRPWLKAHRLFFLLFRSSLFFLASFLHSMSHKIN